MLNPKDLIAIETDLVELARLEHLGTAESAWLAGLDALKPPGSVTVNEWTEQRRYHLVKEIPVKNSFALTPYVPGITACADMEGVEVIAVQGNARSGKALALCTPLPTPTGWTTMGEVREGDSLLGADGLPCKVIFATGVQQHRLCYDVKFSDGSVITADAEHLWEVDYHVMARSGETRTHEWRTKVLRTSDMVDKVRFGGGRNRFRVRNAAPVDLPPVELPIDPYVLGCWLGDGTSRNSHLTVAEADSEIMDHLRDAGVICDVLHRTATGTLTVSMRLSAYDPTKCCRGHNIDDQYSGNTCRTCSKERYQARRDGRPFPPVPNLTRALTNLGLLRNKHVPEIYLRASIAQRAALLQGLMDTDGTCSPGGSASFTGTEVRLADAVFELACSLGMKPTRRKRIPWCHVDGKRIRGAEAHTVNFRAYRDRPIFRLRRKAANLPLRENAKLNDASTRRIVAITPVASVPVRCIQVDNADHLFLAGRAMIPTHNTVGAESIALKRFAHGPYGDLLWYMQSKDDVADYIEERGEWMLNYHEQIAEKIDRKFKRAARDRWKIGESQARYLAATRQTTRGKAAPFIVADEIDAYQIKIAKAILTLLRNRQREFGSNSLMYLASHPDLGPSAGISSIIRDGLRHLWYWTCIHCGKASSPAAEAPIRMNWNVPGMMPMLRDVERADALEYVRQNARLVCPHCRGLINDSERLIMSRETGAWVQPQQVMTGPKKVDGPHMVEQVMGFIIHAFMAPFVTMRDVAPEWYSAQMTYNLTQDDEPLRQTTVKTLGEVMGSASEDLRLEGWEIIRKRMIGASNYRMRTVPDGVDFLIAFIDIQKRGFEVRVIGYSARSKESWLIDAYLIGERREEGRNLDKIDPFHNLDDWSVLEAAVLDQAYPRADDPDWYLPIARVGIDTGGMDETTQNARDWAGSVMYRAEKPVPEWRILLTKGNRYKTGELYGKPRQVEFDDRGVALSGPVWERTILVWQLKKIIRSRQNITMPGPGFMHAPQDLPDQYFKEIASEQMIGDEWVPDGPNETWDAYVAGEVVRESLKPERDELDFINRPPLWAKEFRPGIDPGIDSSLMKLVSPYARMLRINQIGVHEDGLSGTERR